MSQPAIRPDIHQALDIHLDALAQIPFDFALSFDDRADPAEIIFSQIADARINAHLRFVENRG